ncbi:unnamed protein product [Rangifer tarandus platyrhynchus]|uniref:Uncharacterized protein n=1 Tax=Rangifer tarandus platyrhynchus TaxID=3082113 RepID=A0ABN8ZUH7_RANTA|nr:unnamed protein product [Rangifer tarandus platyrhynchus]
MLWGRRAREEREGRMIFPLWKGGYSHSEGWISEGQEYQLEGTSDTSSGSFQTLSPHLFLQKPLLEYVLPTSHFLHQRSLKLWGVGGVKITAGPIAAWNC